MALPAHPLGTWETNYLFKESHLPVCWSHCVKWKSVSPVWLFATPWTVAHQVPLFMEFSSQEYLSGLPCPSPGYINNNKTYILKQYGGTSLAFQWLRFCSPTAGGMGLIPGSRRSPGEGNDYTLQYSWLENSMNRGTWWATVHGVAKSRAWLRDWQYSLRHYFHMEAT